MIYVNMSVKIRISYTTSQELEKVLKYLKPIVKSCKPDKGANGIYKKAYVELNIWLNMAVVCRNMNHSFLYE